MTRKTSFEAYKTIKEKGLLSKRRWEVYDVLHRHGPHTANEVFVILLEESKGAHNAASNSAARFSELRDRGVIKELGTRKCSVTGMEVILWGCTDKLPVEPPKEEPSHCVKCPWCAGKGKVKLTPKEVTTIVHYGKNQGVQLDIFGANL